MVDDLLAEQLHSLFEDQQQGPSHPLADSQPLASSLGLMAALWVISDARLEVDDRLGGSQAADEKATA